MVRTAHWKSIERKVALRLGGRRVPITGRQRGDVPDIEHPLFALEVKHTSRPPERIEQAMRQAEACVRDGKVAVAVIHANGQDIGRSLVVMRLGDFADHFGT